MVVNIGISHVKVPTNLLPPHFMGVGGWPGEGLFSDGPRSSRRSEVALSDSVLFLFF